MLMGHSIEGRFPFLDPNVTALANSLPPEFKLRVLDEKHILKRASADLLPASILARKKQPYRAPDVLAFLGASAMKWVDDILAPAAVTRAGIFEPKAVDALWSKCKARAREPQFSNTDNMALIGVLSTQLLHARLVQSPPSVAVVEMKTLVDCAG
jgi:asparagine synthase (glutamine-hydrolysing)